MQCRHLADNPVLQGQRQNIIASNREAVLYKEETTNVNGNMTQC
jgi:hypothetical protein